MSCHTPAQWPPLKANLLAKEGLCSRDFQGALLQQLGTQAQQVAQFRRRNAQDLVHGMDKARQVLQGRLDARCQSVESSDYYRYAQNEKRENEKRENVVFCWSPLEYARKPKTLENAIGLFGETLVTGTLTDPLF